jgi:hypothetical protein
LIPLLLDHLTSGCKHFLTEDGKRPDSEIVTTINSFFTPSAKEELTDSIVRSYPDRFSECLLMTPEECFDKRQKKQSSDFKEKSNDSQVILIKDSEISILIKSYQDKIKSNKIILDQIKAVWIANDESRVRVELKIEGKKITKDLLLFKEKRWQIIEIANENEYPNFAQPSESNKYF